MEIPKKAFGLLLDILLFLSSYRAQEFTYTLTQMQDVLLSDVRLRIIFETEKKKVS